MKGAILRLPSLPFDTMEYRLFGSTGLLVSVIGFGGHAIGGHGAGDGYGHTDDAESERAITAAWDLGCNLFDTAHVYGDGHSERLIGAALKAVGAINEAIIVTKAGRSFDGTTMRQSFSATNLVASVDESLRRLNRGHLDVLLLHNPGIEIIDNGSAFECLDGLRRLGKIRHYGASVHLAAEALSAGRYPQVSAIQIVYNLLAHLYPDGSGAGLLGRWSADFGARVGLMAREPLANGFLAGKYSKPYEFDENDVRSKIPEAHRNFRIRAAEMIREELPDGITLAQAALRFVLDERAFSTAIVGMKTVRQVQENVSAVSLPPLEDMLSRRNIPEANP